jgi:AraC-like DNA-binding protein
MEIVVLQKTAEALPDFPYPVEGNFKFQDFKHYYDFHMFEPSIKLAPFVAYYSIFVPKMPSGHELKFTQVLQVPAASLMFSRKKSCLFGVTTKRIEHQAILGDIKIRAIFKPAGLRAFCPEADMSALVDNRTPIERFFHEFNNKFTRGLLCEPTKDIAVALDKFLLFERPLIDENIVLVNDITRSLDEDEGLITIKQIASKYHRSERSIQALFREYVGVGLKWVVMRSRIVKVLQQVDSPEEIPWAQLAAELGYSTQSHLINDFRNLLGRSPAEFMSLKL